MSSFTQNATIVLVHGAWADGSCWQNVILPLRNNGLQVTCAPIPLTSLEEDIAALERVLERTNGPSVLAGHSNSQRIFFTSCGPCCQAKINSGAGLTHSSTR